MGLNRIIRFSLAHRLLVVSLSALILVYGLLLGALVCFLVAASLFLAMGREFLPPFTEGTLTVNVSAQPGISLVGFITVAGISARNCIMMLSHYLHLMAYEGESFDQKMIARRVGQRDSAAGRGRDSRRARQRHDPRSARHAGAVLPVRMPVNR